MARRMLERCFDDLDGRPLESGPSTTFGLGGKSYEIDLSPANLEKLRDVLEPFVNAARPIRGSRSGGRRR